MTKKIFCLITACFIYFVGIDFAHCRYVLIDKTVAFVGEKVILASDLERYICFEALKMGKPVESLEKKDLLMKMIDEIVLVQEATKTGIVKADQESVEKRMKEIRVLIDGKSGWCKSPPLGEKYVAEMARNESVITEFIRDRIEVFVKIAEKDAYRYYLSRRDIYEEGYNKEVEERVREELKKVLVERELSNYLSRVKKRVKIDIVEE